MTAALTLVACALLSAEPERRRVAVGKLEALGTDPEVVRVVQELLAVELGSRSDLDVITQAETVSLLSFERSKQLLGCADEVSCQSQLGSMLNADKLLNGSVGSLGQSVLISLQLVDVRRGQVDARAAFQSSARREDLVPATRAAVAQLFQVPSRLQLLQQVPGARVLVDDQLVGVSPVEPLPLSRSGEATLRVEHADYPPLERRISLVPGRTTRVTLEMLSFPELEARSRQRRWTGLGLGGVSLASVVAGSLLVSAGATQWRALDAADARRTPQAELDAMTDRSRAELVSGYAAVGVGAVGLGVALYLLLSDPYAAQLESAAK